MNVGAKDISSVARVAWEVYHRCYLITRDSPEEYQQLVGELGSLQQMLESIRDAICSRNTVYLITGERRLAFHRTMCRFLSAFETLDAIVSSFRALATDSGMDVWRRSLWGARQSGIHNIRARLMAHASTLILVLMDQLETSTLLLIERWFEESLISNADDEVLKRASSILTETPLTAMRKLISDTDRMRFRPVDAPRPSSPTLGRDDHVISASPECKSSGSTPLISLISLDSTRTSDKDLIDLSNLQGSRKPGVYDRFIFGLFGDDDPEDDKTNENGDVLLQVPSGPTDIYIPLQNNPPNPAHLVPEGIAQEFHNSLVSMQLQATGKAISTRVWLRCATWWLLKSRKPVQLNRQSTTSLSSTVDLCLSQYQALLDLRKASWIIYDVILKEKHLVQELVDENRKLFYDVIGDFERDFDFLEPFRHFPEDVLSKLNYNIWERLEPAEEDLLQRSHSSGLSEILDEDPQRWITVNEEDAGLSEEHIVFRGFVNAKIGGKLQRIRTTGTPYLLLVSGKEGESEPIVTLINQTGSLCLSKDFSTVDVTSMRGVELAGLLKCIHLKFTEMEAFVEFIQLDDFELFKAVITKFFTSVKDRIARQGESPEPIFRAVLDRWESSEIRPPSTPRSSLSTLQGTRTTRHCELRIYETPGDRAYGWHSSRRVVITTPPFEKETRCKSYFLPMSHVRLSRSDSREVVVRWSDLGHKVVRTLGDYVPRISFIYDEKLPNVSHVFKFRSSSDANKFEDAVLGLSIDPEYSFDSNEEIRRVFLLRDGGKTSHYKLLQLIRRRQEESLSELFYVSRNSDFTLSDSGKTIVFPNLLSPDYFSNHIDQLHEAASRIELTRCSQKPASLTLKLNWLRDSQDLLNALTSHWELRFSAAVPYLYVKEAAKSSRFRIRPATTLVSGAANISIWEKRGSRRLLVNWNTRSLCLTGDDGEWARMSITLPEAIPAVLKLELSSVVVPVEEVVRGSHWDMRNLVAVGKDGKAASGGKPRCKGRWEVEIEVGEVEMRRGLVEALIGIVDSSG